MATDSEVYGMFSGLGDAIRQGKEQKLKERTQITPEVMLQEKMRQIAEAESPEEKAQYVKEFNELGDYVKRFKKYTSKVTDLYGEDALSGPKAELMTKKVPLPPGFFKDIPEAPGFGDKVLDKVGSWVGITNADDSQKAFDSGKDSARSQLRSYIMEQAPGFDSASIDDFIERGMYEWERKSKEGDDYEPKSDVNVIYNKGFERVGKSIRKVPISRNKETKKKTKSSGKKPWEKFK